MVFKRIYNTNFKRIETEKSKQSCFQDISVFLILALNSLLFHQAISCGFFIQNVPYVSLLVPQPLMLPLLPMSTPQTIFPSAVLPFIHCSLYNTMVFTLPEPQQPFSFR